MIIACILSGMAGAILGVGLMACFIAGANEDRYMEKMNGRETQYDDGTEN